MLVNIPALIAIHRSFLAQLHGDAEDTAAFALLALDQLGGSERLLSSMAQGLLGGAEWLRGQLADAEQAFVVQHRRVAEPASPWPWGSTSLGQVQRAQGRLDAATETYQRTLDIAAVSGPRARWPRARRAWARLAYQRNELDPRARAGHRGHRAVPGVPLPRAARRGPGHPGLDPAGPG